MRIKKVNIYSDILFSQFGYPIDEEDATEYISQNILQIKDRTLIIFDFRDLTFHHYFARPFGTVYKKSMDKNEFIDVIFQCHDYQVDDLLLGLVDNQNIKFSQDKDGEIQKFFLKKKYSIKLMLSESVITFFSNLNDDTKRILEFINRKFDTDFDDLYKEHILQSGENLYPIIEELIHKRFIYSDSDRKYHSVYKYLKT